MDDLNQSAGSKHRSGWATFFAMAAIVLLSGCASTPEPEFQTSLPEGTLARPHRIIVYDFAGTRAELPADSQIAAYLAADDQAQSPEDMTKGRALGREVGRQVIKHLNDAGIEALPASQAGEPRVATS